MTNDLKHFKRIITYYLITENASNAIFNQQAFEKYLQQKPYGKYYKTWRDIFKTLNVVNNQQVVDKLKHITSKTYQTINQQADDYGYTLLYNPTGLEHGVIKPLTNLSIYLMTNQALSA